MSRVFVMAVFTLPMLIAGCVSSNPEGAIAPSDALANVTIRGEGAIGVLFNITGPDHRIDVHGIGRDDGAPAVASITMFNKTRALDSIRLYSTWGGGAHIVSDVRTFRVGAHEPTGEEGYYRFSYYEFPPEYWNETFFAIIASGAAEAPGKFTLWMNGTDIRTEGELVRGTAWTIPPDTWTGPGQVVVDEPEPHGSAFLGSLKTSWRTQHATFAIFLQDVWAQPGLTVEDTTLKNHNASWTTTRAYERTHRASVNPTYELPSRAFTLLAPPDEWTFEIRARASTEASSMSLLIADLPLPPGYFAADIILW